MKISKKNVKYIKYIVIIFAVVYSLGIISKPFTSFEKRITIKSVGRWRHARYRRKVSLFPLRHNTRIYFTDENNKKYYYEDSVIFGVFGYKKKELEKIKKGNNVIIKGYKNYLSIIPENIVYDVE